MVKELKENGVGDEPVSVWCWLCATQKAYYTLGHTL